MSCVRIAWPSVAPAGFAKYATRAYILLRDRRQRLGVDGARDRAQPARLAQPRPIECVADRARVGEMRQPLPARDVLAESLRRRRVEVILHALEHAIGDEPELGRAVVWKVDVMRDAR